MNSQEGIALRLNAEGHIAEILSDSLGLGDLITIGMPFARLAASGSLSKALSFLTELEKRGAVYNWEFTIEVEGIPRVFHFTGGKSGADFIVVAALNGVISLRNYEEMMRINNEQTNALRTAYQSLQRDTGSYDEITRLNNELVGIQRELAKKNAELIQLNKEKNHFLGIAAHDLRNPLHAILLLSEFLMDEITEGEQREFLEEIRNSSNFMARLVDDLLDVAKIESGRIELEYVSCDIVNLAKMNVQRNGVIAARKNVTVDLVEETLPRVLVDIAKFEQVLNNLIGNALKFSTPGGRIEVRILRKDDSFQMEVQDWGTGIPPEIQSVLFTPFGKGKAGTAGEKSSGLGLVIVKRIVEAHEGKIWIESTLGVGSTFFVTLPFQPKAMSKSA